MGLLDKIREIFGGKSDAPDAPSSPAPTDQPPAAPSDPPLAQRPEGDLGGEPPQHS